MDRSAIRPPVFHWAPAAGARPGRPAIDPDPRTTLRYLLPAAIAPSVGALLLFHLAPGTVGSVAYAAGKVVLYGLPLLWILRIERARPSLPRPTRAGLGRGALSGLALGGVVLAAWYGGVEARVDPEALRARAVEAGFDTRARYLLMSAWIVVGNALLEEYAFRAFIHRRCRALVGPLGGVLLAAAIFTAHHVIVLRAYFAWPLVALGSAGVFAAGLVWTWHYEREGNVWPGYASHMLADAALLWIGWELLFAGG